MTTQLHSLPNGLRIVTEQMPSLKSASVGLWVNAGGRDEAPRENGIAHFLEHMAFKGTERRSARQIAEDIEDVGGYINAYTSRETTAFYARILGENLDTALDVIADIVQNPVFDEREIEVERGVILQEIGQALDTPDDVIFDWLQEVAYPDQAIGRSILGSTEMVQGFSQADLRGFVERHYRPDRMILAAAGDVDHEAIVAQAAALFGGVPRPGDNAPLQARFASGERHEVKTLEQAHVAIGFEAPGYRDDRMFAAQIFSTAFGGGMSSRLFQEARERRGLCYSIYSSTGAYADTGMFTIYAGTSEEDLGELAMLTMDELARASDGLTEAELSRARAQMKSGLLIGLESPSARAERNARLLSIWGRVPGIEETVAKIDAVTLNDVRDFAQSMAQGAAAMALYGPVGGAPHLDDLLQRLGH